MGDLKYLDLHGDRVAYLDEGQGEVILLLHGMAGSSQTWRSVIRPLSRKYRVVAPTCSATATRPNRAATTRWARSRSFCATCSTSWASRRRPSSGTPSAAGWPCSSSTNTPTTASA